jgi:chemotaxis methyl-accepting protein methylase
LTRLRPKSRKKLLRPAPVRKPQPAAVPVPALPRFPIVGIGTSAGGLEALERFFRHVPEGSGLAYVVVQHLDPTHKAMLPELLRRFTGMRVFEVNRRMRVQPNCVYVMPPAKGLSMNRGTLLPVDPDAPRGQRLPIDRFLRSLAEEHRDLAVGVILSGMGSDGSLGLRTIKEQAGLVLVQDPAEAGFDGMPRSAIATRDVDIIGLAAELPARILAYFRHPVGALGTLDDSDGHSGGDLEQVLIALRSRTGHDFLRYKKTSVQRRIERRMGIHQLDKMASYVRYTAENPQELDLLFKELLIGVTSFFRDPAAWELLGEQVLPALLADHADGGSLRAWVPACSTGEEAYTLAMVFQEALARLKPKGRFKLQIFATDIDADAIEKARKGIYPPNVQADLSATRLTRFFQEDGGAFRVRGEIREMVTFAPQDVLLDPPFTKLDILCCRNLLIYLGADLQNRLMTLFHYSLRPGGTLFLGSAEAIGKQQELFAPLDPKIRLFQRRDMLGRRAVGFDPPAGRLPVSQPASDEVKGPIATTLPSLAAVADQLLLQRFSPAAVLVNENGDILYINGRTGKYLEPATGQANWNVHAMAREGLREPLGLALRKAARSHGPVEINGITVGTNGGTQTVDVRVQAIEAPVQVRGMLMVVFADVPAPAPAGRTPRRKPVAHSREAELLVRQAREDSRHLYEDMQTAQEELKSANEELQSTNEELQSTNEELTTSREEMQSMNEELQTVNAELRSKVDELTHASNDMKNLLDSTDIATVFLDTELRVRRFTPHATEIFKLIPGDVSRPLSDIVTQLDYPRLERDVGEVLRTLVFCEHEISASGGRWFRVRIMPYRTMDNRIDGVVITFANITAQKRLEAQLRKDAHSP